MSRKSEPPGLLSRTERQSARITRDVAALLANYEAQAEERHRAIVQGLSALRAELRDLHGEIKALVFSLAQAARQQSQGGKHHGQQTGRTDRDGVSGA